MGDELEDLKRRVAELEAKQPKPNLPSTPMPRIDWTEGSRVGMRVEPGVPDVMRAELAAAGLRAQGLKPIAQEPAEPVVRGTGWAPEVPFGPAPGIDLIDRLVDHQDALDRVELAARLTRGKPDEAT